MTDNRTTELLPCPFCGGEAQLYTWNKSWVSHGCNVIGGYIYVREFDTEAEAIAAWNARADYHGYEQAATEAWKSIKTWNTRAKRGTLTAEQVRECIQHVYYDGYNDGSVHRGHGIEETNWQAIADELNSELAGRKETYEPRTS